MTDSIRNKSNFRKTEILFVSSVVSSLGIYIDNDIEYRILSIEY